MNLSTSPTYSNTKTVNQIELEDGYAEMDLEEKEMAGVDLEHLEHAYRHQKLYTIP
jgi:hypothetical protein